MIESVEIRSEVANAFAKAIDELVEERMAGLVEEPDITSRLGQCLEDRFNGKVVAGYNVKILTETITSHGPASLEKPTGADLYLVVSVDDGFAPATTKALLVQAKRRDRIDQKELTEQCRRMNLITKKGSVVWVYDRNGVQIQKSVDVVSGRIAPFRSTKFFDDVFACKLGDKRKVPEGQFGDRPAVRDMLRGLGATNAAWLNLEKQR